MKLLGLDPLIAGQRRPELRVAEQGRVFDGADQGGSIRRVAEDLQLLIDKPHPIKPVVVGKGSRQLRQHLDGGGSAPLLVDHETAFAGQSLDLLLKEAAFFGVFTRSGDLAIESFDQIALPLKGEPDVRRQQDGGEDEQSGGRSADPPAAGGAVGRQGHAPGQQPPG